jgi:hypothetical protein
MVQGRQVLPAPFWASIAMQAEGVGGKAYGAGKENSCTTFNSLHPLPSTFHPPAVPAIAPVS